jgi:hypothetical protein
MTKKGKTLATLTDARVKRWRQRFLRSLRKVPNVKAACAAASVSRQTAYRNRHDDAEFSAAWQDALDASVDELEAVAFKIALEGDPQLLQFMLRCHRSDVYKETSRHEIDARLCGIVLVPEKENREP